MTLLDIYDPKAPPTPIGVDLGTTNSIVAYVSDSRPAALTTCDGAQLLPSVVYYAPEGGVTVGHAAKSHATSEPERTLASVKRFLGRGHGVFCRGEGWEVEKGRKRIWQFRCVYPGRSSNRRLPCIGKPL